MSDTDDEDMYESKYNESSPVKRKTSSPFSKSWIFSSLERFYTALVEYPDIIIILILFIALLLALLYVEIKYDIFSQALLTRETVPLSVQNNEDTDDNDDLDNNPYLEEDDE